jgi:hypothetical protein
MRQGQGNGKKRQYLLDFIFGEWAERRRHRFVYNGEERAHAFYGLYHALHMLSSHRRTD